VSSTCSTNVLRTGYARTASAVRMDGNWWTPAKRHLLWNDNHLMEFLALCCGCFGLRLSAFCQMTPGDGMASIHPALSCLACRLCWFLDVSEEWTWIEHIQSLCMAQRLLIVRQRNFCGIFHPQLWFAKRLFALPQSFGHYLRVYSLCFSILLFLLQQPFAPALKRESLCFEIMPFAWQKSSAHAIGRRDGMACYQM